MVRDPFASTISISSRYRKSMRRTCQTGTDTRTRAHSIEGTVALQIDWGQEFGGDNPRRVTQLSERFLRPLGGELTRYPPEPQGIQRPGQA